MGTVHKQNANTEAARPPSSPVVAVAVALKFEAYGHGFRQKGCSVILTCDVKILVREGIAVPERDGKRLSLCAVPTETPLHQNGALAVQWHSGRRLRSLDVRSVHIWRARVCPVPFSSLATVRPRPFHPLLLRVVLPSFPRWPVPP